MSISGESQITHFELGFYFLNKCSLMHHSELGLHFLSNVHWHLIRSLSPIKTNLGALTRFPARPHCGKMGTVSLRTPVGTGHLEFHRR